MHLLLSTIEALTVSSVHPLIPTSWALPLGILLVFVVIVLVGWALQLMQAAMDQGEFSLMLAGCMVCSAAVGLATVMVMTLSDLPL
ncbi:putative conserved membrane protein [Synechococcus sp. BIOS-U3-1]|uniref:hypothetical protein n=1 Tax=Synechococcus sp. BIOS-U3-1 TaxID=1400865 RepID=UPI00186290C1|nr:hypothetical protein [Synechococcus sp. BIOS-U3-1]QNI57648.1 putative conserved membrane protein [Synechococcus sp. BIOS-U3-1]